MVWTKIVDNVSRNLAFRPPVPSSYTIEAHGDQPLELYVRPVVGGIKKVPKAIVHRVSILGSEDEQIIFAYIESPTKSPGSRQCTILHSHGNAVDLGQMLPLYETLARILKVNVAAYDYRGYGLSRSRRSKNLPSVSGTLQDVKTALHFLLDHYGKRLQDIVVYGQSVGTGPTCWVASQNPQLAGCILHSPLSSGVRVLYPNIKVWPSFLDIFVNLKVVPKIKCRVLIMHGTEDEVIHVSHGRRLHALCKLPSDPFWAEGRNHHNMESHPMFIPTLKRFLGECFGDEYRKQFGK